MEFIGGRVDQPIVDPLVIAFAVIVLDVLTHHPSKMTFTDRNGKGEPTLSAHEVARQIYLGLPDSPKSDTVRREISRLKPRTTPLGR